MPSTTNFGWTTPADTDLVKDGAAAIRTLGNGVDSSFVDLKGGTTGQILSKNSNTDLDFVWIANDQGDITAVTAGTGISGGGSSGAVTITNSMATAITTAGDIIYGTGSGTFSRLGIGTAGQVLKVNSGATAPEWAAAATDTNDFKLIDNTTFSAVTSFSRDDVFSATYDIYKIYIRGTSSAGLVWSLRFRAGGTDTTTNYIAQRLNAINTTVSASRPANTSEISTFPIETVDSLIEITVVNPFASTRTTGFSTTSAEGQSLYYSAFGQTGTTSFDGYKFLSGGSETITGEQWVYGLKV